MNWNDIFHYNQSTGELTWKKRDGAQHDVAAFNKRFAGKVAGVMAYASPDKYRARGIVIRYRPIGKDLYAHRIVWEMHNGPIPQGMMIDHVNGNAFDNRLSNIRLATHTQNMHNAGISKRNNSGVKGVHYDKTRDLWVADLRVNNKRHRLGRFATKGLAAVARAKAALRYHGEFVRFA